MNKVKLALAILVSLPATLILVIACSLHGLMAGIFYLVQQSFNLLFATDKSSSVKILPTNKQQQLQRSSQTSASQVDL